MSVFEYQNSGPLEIPASLDPPNLAGKSVVVTGGASGLGRAYAQAFVGHGAYVTVVDFNKTLGTKVVEELGSQNAQFAECDVTNWQQLVEAFEMAVRDSPRNSCDIVIANAGINGPDDLFTFEDPHGPPLKPDLKIMDINMTGVLYTVKLALHYFRKQPVGEPHDRCLILKSSLAGYVDLPGSIQYNASKFGVRGTMRSLRCLSWKENFRVNVVAPWFIRTPIIPQSFQEFLETKGVGFALAEDCARAMLFLASETKINGRALGVVSRQQHSNGVIDLGLDDFPRESPYYEWQQVVLSTV